MSLRKREKVLVAMSGGVDSSAAAFILKSEGYDVSGLHMRLGDEYQESEIAARRVCEKLKIKFFPVNISAKFQKNIISYFIDSYRRGETPNPCVRCNKLIKFGELLRWQKKLGADYLATGHYIQKKFNSKSDEFELHKAVDREKDQSYFLYNLGQDELANVLFPLGGLLKKDLKDLIQEKGVPALKKESMDICFLYRRGVVLEQNEFLKEHLDLKPGPIKLITEQMRDGKRITRTIGMHKGLPLYTIGQRRGVEIGGTGPFYVAAMSYPQDALYVVKDPEDELLYSKGLYSIDNNFVCGKLPTETIGCQAVIRFRHKGVEARVKKAAAEQSGMWLNLNKNKKTLETIFLADERAVTVGQSIVWYDNERLLGGGVISGRITSGLADFVI